MKITRVRLQRLRLELDPPFLAAWDPEPRRQFDATLVFVETDAGIVGIGSGDTMAGFEPFEELFIGTDPTNIRDQVRRIQSIGFHAGRFWPLEVAFWDILGKVAGLPVSQLLGGASTVVAAYASTGQTLTPAERVESALAIREAGFRAMKVRIDMRDWRAGLAAVSATRDAVGPDMEIMVDLNQGWRMPGDVRPLADYITVRQVVEELCSLGVYWIEEPLPYTDRTGMRRLREETGMRIASGEMNDDLTQVLGWLDDDAVDIYQMDAVLSLGISRVRMFAELAAERNRRFTPHSWTNGIGVLANLHLSAGVGGGPYFEYPFDPPGWTPERRDFMLASPIRIDDSGNLHVPEAPGFGIQLDDDACARTVI